MSDHHVDEQFAAYLNDELPVGGREKVEQHLGTCDRCRGTLRSLTPVHDALVQLRRLSPPDAVWHGVRAGLPSEKPRVTRLRRQRFLWACAAAVAGVAILAVLWFNRTDSGRIPLDSYFASMERAVASSESFPLEDTVDLFRRVDERYGLQAAGMGHADAVSPLPGFDLWRSAVYAFSEGEVVQLTYRGDGKSFNVLMAPHAASFDFGNRKTARVKMGDWECTQIESDVLSLFWSVSGDRQSVFVARPEDGFDVATVLRYFVYGGWERESGP